MPLVTLAELKATLNIGDLYADPVLEQVIATATNTILALVTRDRQFISSAAVLTSLEEPDVGTQVEFYTTYPHEYAEGDLVRLGEYPRAGFTDRLFTVVEITGDLEFIAAATTVFDPGVTAEQPIIPAGLIYRESAREFYETVPEVREAALAIAVDVFQSRVAPGGQTQAIDFTPGPYRLGRSLFTRVSGLLGRWVEVGSLIG